MGITENASIYRADN